MTTSTQQKFVLRFESDKLKDKLEKAAKKNKRSINSELLHRLEASFETNKTINKLQKQHDSLQNIEDMIKGLISKKNVLA